MLSSFLIDLVGICVDFVRTWTIVEVEREACQVPGFFAEDDEQKHAQNNHQTVQQVASIREKTLPSYRPRAISTLTTIININPPVEALTTIGRVKLLLEYVKYERNGTIPVPK